MTSSSFIDRIIIFMAVGLGLGLSPVAPGTIGSLLAIPLWLAISRFPTVIYILSCLGFAMASVWIAGRAAGIMAEKDPSRVVIDEIVGMLVALQGLYPYPLTLLGTFVLFRFFDIIKPFPVKQMERLPGGFGIVMDDVAAGILANVIWRTGEYIYYAW